MTITAQKATRVEKNATRRHQEKERHVAPPPIKKLHNCPRWLTRLLRSVERPDKHTLSYGWFLLQRTLPPVKFERWGSLPAADGSCQVLAIETWNDDEIYSREILAFVERLGLWCRVTLSDRENRIRFIIGPTPEAAGIPASFVQGVAA